MMSDHENLKKLSVVAGERLSTHSRAVGILAGEKVVDRTLPDGWNTREICAIHGKLETSEEFSITRALFFIQGYFDDQDTPMD